MTDFTLPCDETISVDYRAGYQWLLHVFFNLSTYISWNILDILFLRVLSWGVILTFFLPRFLDGGGLVQRLSAFLGQ